MLRPVLYCVVAVTAVTATGCSGSSHKPADVKTVQVSVTSCGVGWKPTKAGQQHIVLADTDSRAGDVMLVNPRSGTVFAEVEPIGAGTTANLDVSLAAGTYALRCTMEDETSVTGPSVTITGPATDAAPGVIAVTQADLIPATKAYEHYVSSALPGLVKQAAALRGDLAADNTAKAKTDWLATHMSYERLGAAYDAFGDLDNEIQTAFHQIEDGLWHGSAPAKLLPQVDALTTSVGKLAGVFAKTQVAPLTISIRAHEISENALQFELTGQDDHGSHSELATVSANLDGTKTVLTMVEPLLVTRDKNLATIKAQLATAQRLVNAQHTAAGWTPLDALSRSAREQINAAISELCEQLAPVAAILEPRRTS